MENNDPQSSRFGADNRFTKAYVNWARVQKVTDRVSILIRGAGQASTRPLVVTEQFFIGGADSVRGYPLGQFLGDDGYNSAQNSGYPPCPIKKFSSWPFSSTMVEFLSKTHPLALRSLTS